MFSEKGSTYSIIFFDIFKQYNYVLQTVKFHFPQVFPWKVWITITFFNKNRGVSTRECQKLWKTRWRKLKKAILKAKNRGSESGKICKKGVEIFHFTTP